jgi:hypothetical protein
MRLGSAFWRSTEHPQSIVNLKTSKTRDLAECRPSQLALNHGLVNAAAHYGIVEEVLKPSSAVARHLSWRARVEHSIALAFWPATTRSMEAAEPFLRAL